MSDGLGDVWCALWMLPALLAAGAGVQLCRDSCAALGASACLMLQLAGRLLRSSWGHYVWCYPAPAPASVHMCIKRPRSPPRAAAAAAATHPARHLSLSLCRITFSIATRGLVGLRNQLLTATRGMGIVNTIFDEYRPLAGDIMNREQGSLVAFETGQVTAYALESAQERGLLFCRWVAGWTSCAGVASCLHGGVRAGGHCTCCPAVAQCDRVCLHRQGPAVDTVSLCMTNAAPHCAC